jgi:predicted CDP-diglyceride synthetase/phosphatidate cytidylyltransferase
MNQPQTESLWLIGSVIFVLGAASIVGWFLKRRLDTGLDPAVVEQFHRRVRIYWLMCTVLATSLIVDQFFVRQYVTVIVFGLISFWALREFITLTPTRRGDHRGLFWLFFIFTPAQYLLVALDLHVIYSVLIPAFAFLFLAARVAFAGDSKRYLERTAKIQTGLMICVYCLSYAPALLTHDLDRQPDSRGGAVEKSRADTLRDADLDYLAELLPTRQAEADKLRHDLAEHQRQLAELDAGREADDAKSRLLQAKILDLQRQLVGKYFAAEREIGRELPEKTMMLPAERARLLFFFVLIAQLSDVMQYVWGKLVPARVIAPEINASKTWSGFLGGILSSAVLGALLWWSIDPPFKFWEAALLSAAVAAVGLAGGLTMSAIKRDRGVKDFGTLVVGHGGVLDRIDGVCFAAPAFFYLSRFFLWLDKACISPTPW